MYSKKRLSRMSDAELMTVFSDAREEIYRLHRKDPDMIRIGRYTDAEETMVRTLRTMVRRGFYRPTHEEEELLEENRRMKRAVSASIDYRCFSGSFRGEADIGRYADVLRRAHPEFVSDLTDDCDVTEDSNDKMFCIAGPPYDMKGMEPDGRGAGTIRITFDDGTYVVHCMSSYPKGVRDLLISIVRWSSEGGGCL